MIKEIPKFEYNGKTYQFQKVAFCDDCAFDVDPVGCGNSQNVIDCCTDKRVWTEIEISQK